LSKLAAKVPVDVAIFLRNLAGGGIERVMLDLAEAFTARGKRVEIVLSARKGARIDEVPAGVEVIELGRSSQLRARALAAMADPLGLSRLTLPVLLARKPPPTLASLESLARYLRRRRPRSLLSATAFENLEAIRARRLAGVPTRLVVTEHSNLARNLLSSKEWARRHLVPLMARNYPRADAIVAVSYGVAEQIAAILGLPRERVTTIYNPVVTPGLLAQMRAPVDEPWTAPGSPPLVMGAGRLARPKDFPTLVRAFAIARRTRPLRLVIAGGGDSPAGTAERQRALMRLARELGVAEDVKLPGHLKNPAALMARAHVFVLSSAWEGLGNVVVEALACGTPVVSTDCPSGPAEILEGGRHGRLVPVGDPEAMAAAILATLDAPPDRDQLRRRAMDFGLDRAADAYAALLLGSASA
jgi:glycosyltransferase involved in cell wall biosynthesis